MVFKLKKPQRKVNEKMTLEALHKSAETYREMYDNIRKKNDILQKQLDRAIWWLNEIVTNHRFTPISTAEKALKEIEESNK